MTLIDAYDRSVLPFVFYLWFATVRRDSPEGGGDGRLVAGEANIPQQSVGSAAAVPVLQRTAHHHPNQSDTRQPARHMIFFQFCVLPKLIKINFRSPPPP